MSKKQEPKSDSKTFSLRPAESKLLIFTKNHQDAIFSGILSTIAADRFSQTVTERTQFQLSADMTQMTLTELPAEDEGKPEQDPSVDESPIKEAA